jgi:hypothetical protein
MSHRDNYEAGLDLLGASSSVGDFVPYLNLIGKALGGVGGMLSGGSSGGSSASDQQAAIAKALADQKQKEELAKAQAAAQRNELILIGTLGAISVGGLVYALTRKRK